MRTPAKGERLTFEFSTGDNEQRLRELILYIVQKCGDHALFGATKLNKVLYYADFYSYAKFGKPITGVAYQHLKNGPAPKRLLPVQNEMAEQGELRVFRKQLLHGRWQTRFEALRDANVGIFSGAEIALVDQIIEYLRDKTAEVVSEESHLLPWRLTNQGDLIPYEYVFLVDLGVTESDVAWAREVAERRYATS